MKQKDIMLIAVIVIISAVLSMALSNVIITPPKNRQQAVEVIDPITAEFNLPSKKYFSNKSIDPTQVINISDNSNPKPLN